MSVQRSVAARDASNNSFETVVGTSPVLRFRTGAKPAACASSRSGTILAAVSLPSDWLGASASGTKSKNGTWADIGIANGVIGHYEIMDSSLSTCHEQGEVTVTGGGGPMTVDNLTAAVGQPVTVTGYAFTAGNA